MENQFVVVAANASHYAFAQLICDEMERSAKVRGTGIAKREPSYIRQKMAEGKAVIAFSADGDWAGFCYIESWSNSNYVANSGLIVAPQYRKHGIARLIKQKVFALSRALYPQAKVFGLTTGQAVMRINSELGYRPVVYAELTQDDKFWEGCRSCVNFEILTMKERKNCLCTAMLYDPADEQRTPAVQEVSAPAKQKITAVLLLKKIGQKLSVHKPKDNNYEKSSTGL